MYIIYTQNAVYVMKFGSQGFARGHWIQAQAEASHGAALTCSTCSFPIARAVSLRSLECVKP